MDVDLLRRAVNTFEVFDYVHNAAYYIFENAFQENVLEILKVHVLGFFRH